MSKIIIKGCIYTDGDELLRAHFSGDFIAVDCTEYKTKEQIKKEYNEQFVKQFTDKNAFYLTYEGKKYYECEFSPFNTENMELLSDINEIEFYDDETDFD